MDATLPGMLTAVVARPPVFGATVKQVDADRARAVPGVKAVAQIPSGVAVIATSFWAAKRGRDALRVTWEEGEGARVDTSALEAEYAEDGGDARTFRAARGGPGQPPCPPRPRGSPRATRRRTSPTRPWSR